MNDNDNDILYAIGYNSRISDNLVVYITPFGYWKKNKDIAYEYDDELYDIIYDMTNDVNLIQLMEGVYETSDPYIELEELESELINAGFIKDEEFINFIEETEFTETV
jgi:hypothetical protein